MLEVDAALSVAAPSQEITQTTAMGLQTMQLSDGGQQAAMLALRLQWLFQAVTHKFSEAVSIVQAWLPSPGATGADWRLHSEPRVAVISDARFAQFRLRSCHSPVQFKNSMTGRVWRTGAVQVVQNLRLVPPTMHPRIYLSDADLDSLGEALYIPVYDSNRPGAGPMTVLEALLPAHCQDPICSADLLSFISAGLATLKLSVSNPMPQPIRRSALCGRRARATADSAPDMQQQGGLPTAAGSGAPHVDGNGAAGVGSALPSVPMPVIKTISGPAAAMQPAISSKRSAEEDTAGQVEIKQPYPGMIPGPAAANCPSVLDSSTAQHGPHKPPMHHVRRHSDERPGEACSSGANAPMNATGTVAVSEGGQAEEWDAMPRKVRKLEGGGGGKPKGMVRSQSSFHMAAVAAASSARS